MRTPTIASAADGAAAGAGAFRSRAAPCQGTGHFTLPPVRAANSWAMPTIAWQWVA